MRQLLCPRPGTLQEFCLNDMWDWNMVTHAHTYTCMHTWRHPCKSSAWMICETEIWSHMHTRIHACTHEGTHADTQITVRFLQNVTIKKCEEIQLCCHPSTAFSVTLTFTWKIQWQCIHQKHTHKPSPHWPSQIQSCVYLLWSCWWQLRCTNSTPTLSV